MITLKGIVAGTLLLMPTSIIAEQQIVYPINMPCTSKEKVKDILSKYKELPFAQGMGSLQSAEDRQYHPGQITMYLSFDGSFTITAEMDPGVICLITTGEGFIPLKPDFQTQIQKHMN